MIDLVLIYCLQASASLHILVVPQKPSHIWQGHNMSQYCDNGGCRINLIIHKVSVGPDLMHYDRVYCRLWYEHLVEMDAFSPAHA